MKTTMNYSLGKILVVLLALSVTMTSTYGQITAVSPDSAAQGTTGLTVTIILDADADPPLPPSHAPVEGVMIGTVSGTSVSRISETVVTVVFDILAGEATGVKDVSMTFAGPPTGGQGPTYTLTDGFTVTAMPNTAPSITTQPQSKAVRLGNAVTLKVGVYGSEPMSYQWQKDDIVIVDTNSASYTIDAFRASDTGAYRCFVSNEFGAELSDAALLTVDDSVLAGLYPIVDTGQTACYGDVNEIVAPLEGEAFYGQDAQHFGNQPSYTDNGDGTITDHVTGLMWQQTPANRGLRWQEAADYCETLELGGYDDWRMPTTKELFSISDFSVGWPYLNTTYFDLAETGAVSKDEQYWAEPYVGTTVEGGTHAAFGVNHGTGHIKAYAALVSGPMGNYVRAVRGGSYGANDFVDNCSGTVTDRATGLMWQQADSEVGMDWPTALAYAEDLTLAGYTDWRLPNVKELQSIVDYTKSPSASDEANLGPAIDTDFFTLSVLPEGTTKTQPDYGYYWTSTSAYFGGSSREYYYAWYVAFGTAVNDAGDDFHGAGGVRFDTKIEGGPLGEGGERYYNYVLCVRDVD